MRILSNFKKISLVFALGLTPQIGGGLSQFDGGISSGKPKPPPIPLHIQSGTPTNSSGTSCAVTLGSTVASGDALVGYIQYPTAQTITSILDDQGNSYGVIKNILSGGTLSFASFFLANIRNAPKTVTVTFSASTSQCNEGLDEYSNIVGLDTTTPSGGATGQFGTTFSGTNAFTSGSLTTTSAGDLIWGAFAPTAALPTAGTGFTLRISDGVDGYTTEDLVQTSSGITAATATVSSGGGWAIAMALKAGTPSTFAPFVANSGASSPIYSGNVDPHGVYVPATNTTWVAFEGWNGVYRTEQVTTYNHSTKVWSPIYNAIVSGSVNNDHPNPAICRDFGGYWHMFSGHHPFPMAHSITASPDDPSTWIIQSPLTGPGTSSTSPAAYPHCYAIGSKLYVFVQSATWAQIQLYVSSAIVNGVVTWNAPITILDYGGGSGTTGNRAYQGNCLVVGININCAQTYSNTTDTFSRGLYYWSYNTSTGGLTNLQNTLTTPSGSLPVLKTTLDASYLVHDNSNSTMLTNTAVVGNAVNGNIVLLMQDQPGGPGTTYLNWGFVYSGGVLTGPTQYDTSAGVSSYTVDSQSDGSVIVYYAKPGAPLNGTVDGNIWTITVSASGVWGTPALLQASGSQWPLGEPVAIANPNSAARVFWTEATQNASAPSGTLKAYLYGSGGFVQRLLSSFPSPQPHVLSTPTNGWNPSDMSADMNLVGDNMLANPGTATTTYPSAFSSDDAQVRSLTSHASGKFHVEFLVQQSQQPASAGNGFGVCSASHSLTAFVGGDTTSAALWGDNFYINNTQTLVGGDLTNWPQGYWFAMEIDLTSKLVWYKNITDGGNWNNSGAANPATGTGGISLSALTGSPWFLCTQVSQFQDGIALNAGEFPMLLTPSSGFTSGW